jgi:hypothetical protein
MRMPPLVVAFVLAALVVAADAHAQGEVVVDRTAVRFETPETGGNAHPRFITQRELGFFTRIEALMEGVALAKGEYPERYVRSATDRLVARAMLASLMIQRGTEPPDLPRLASEARADLADRVGGPQVLEDAIAKEGLEDAELQPYLFDQVRAAFWIDRAVAPIFGVTEDSLREAFRSALHPYRGAKFEDVRTKFRRWLVVERARAAELEFLQTARARIKVVSVVLGPS